MLVHTKKHPIKETAIFCLSEQGSVLKLPKAIIKSLTQYAVQDTKLIEKIKKQIQKTLYITPEETFAAINTKYGKPGALVKAIRFREDMNQAQFAATIHITQGDLSKIERGKRSIGKEIAQRISKAFGINPNLLLRI
jgi:DNA-binding transcriptional regulator YiaG